MDISYSTHTPFKDPSRFLQRFYVRRTRMRVKYYSEAEETAWMQKKAYFKKKGENSIQNLQNNTVNPGYEQRLYDTMMESLEQLERKEDEVADLIKKGRDHFGQSVFDASYKQSILNRKVWNDDELIAQMKSYERIYNELGKLSIN